MQLVTLRYLTEPYWSAYAPTTASITGWGANNTVRVTDRGVIMLSTTEMIGQKAKDAIDLTVQLAWQAGYDAALRDLDQINTIIKP